MGNCFFLLAFLTGVAVRIPPHATQPSTRDRHEAFTRLMEKYVENGLVDYEGFRDDPLFDRYLDMLATTSPESLASREEQLAFWINAYNAYTIKLIIDHWPLESIRDIGLGLPVLFGPWSIEIAEIGGEMFTLNDIEHDIIRERFKDARIHFALVCASRSCPLLRRDAYEGSRLTKQLDDDARRFLADTLRNRFDASTGTVHLSKIFDWYGSDFEESKGSVRAFIAPYLDGPARQLVESASSQAEFLPYDWSLNAQ